METWSHLVDLGTDGRIIFKRFLEKFSYYLLLASQEWFCYRPVIML
jgi:hypothetical protein